MSIIFRQAIHPARAPITIPLRGDSYFPTKKEADLFEVNKSLLSTLGKLTQY